MPSYSAYILETFATLLAVVALSVVVLYGARRFGLGRRAGPITLAGVLPLESRRSIYLVKVGETVLVVGVSETGMTRLGELPASAIPETEAQGGFERMPPSAFVVALERMTKKLQRRGEQPS